MLVESNTKIYFTRDYGVFKFLKGNRDINEQKVNKIIAQLKDHLNILQYAPIIVDENFNILDGQHRYTAAMKTKNNIYFVISKNLERKHVPKINSNSSNWKLKDYLNSYVDLKNDNYVFLQEVLNKRRINLPVAAALLMFNSVTVHSADVRQAFEDGEFVVKYEAETEEILKIADDFVDHMVNPYARRFVSVLKKLVGNGKYDHNLMLQKLELSGERITALDTEKVTISQMESIINFKQKTRILIH